MSLNDSMNEVERSKLAVWDYPVSDKYTKIWQSMQVKNSYLFFLKGEFKLMIVQRTGRRLATNVWRGIDSRPCLKRGK